MLNSLSFLLLHSLSSHFLPLSVVRVQTTFPTVTEYDAVKILCAQILWLIVLDSNSFSQCQSDINLGVLNLNNNKNNRNVDNNSGRNNYNNSSGSNNDSGNNNGKGEYVQPLYVQYKLFKQVEQFGSIVDTTLISSKTKNILRNILKAEEEEEHSESGTDSRRAKIPSFLHSDFLSVQPSNIVKNSDLYTAELILKRKNNTGVSTLYERTQSAGYYDVVVASIEGQNSGIKGQGPDRFGILDQILPPTQIFVDMLRGRAQTQTE